MTDSSDEDHLEAGHLTGAITPDPSGVCIAIAIGEYDDPKWKRLEGALQAAEHVTRLMAAAGYKTELVRNPSRREVLDVLTQRERLHKSGFSGPLVMLWTGHGKVIADELALIVRDTPATTGLEDFAYGPKGLVSFAFDCGSRDSLLIIDTCSAGAGDLAAIEATIRRLERATWPGRQPAFACIVSCKGYEKARDGAFLAELLKVLSRSPDVWDSGPFDVYWTPARQTIPLAAVIDRIGRGQGSDQHPRGWSEGSSDICFPNPAFDPTSGPALVDDRLRQVRGQAASVDFLVATPAAEALAHRVDDGPGLWTITGAPGSGKSSCLAWAAMQWADRVLLISARLGLDAVVAAVGRASGDAAILLDSLEEAPPREREALVYLVQAWSRSRFVSVAARPPLLHMASNERTARILGDAEAVVDVGSSEWLGDAISRYVTDRLREAS